MLFFASKLLAPLTLDEDEKGGVMVPLLDEGQEMIASNSFVT